MKLKCIEMELKKYQIKSLDILKLYLSEVTKFDSKHAFISITKRSYKDKFFGNIPFVCIKIPTGGGKTLVGCHSVVAIMNSLTEKMSRGIVMWFVPSEAIKSQTLQKFKNRKDLHRKILDDAFENNIKIFSNEEALTIKKNDVENNLCIIVASIDSFRKNKKLQSKYKVYKDTGSLLNHFQNIQKSRILDRDGSGVLFSLANVIKLTNPIIIIDEGHKTKTKLSIEFLNELNPSFIIEYTATPRDESNVLVEIYSSELNAEEMVKLPLVLESRTQWQPTVLQGVLRRDELEEIAKKEKEPIRPIALLQAEQQKESPDKITVKKIKEYLINERKIPKEEIAIKTSTTNEISGVDLFSKSCKIRYIITVNALAEGWDCSFAYVLISVANIGSKIAVEQIIGRIMRMPFAKRKQMEDLNRSYVFASAKNFNEAITQIISGLEHNGYSKNDIINTSDKKSKNEYEAHQIIHEDFAPLLISLNDEELTFESLIGEDFQLHTQKVTFDFKIHYDNDGKAIIDLRKENKWFRSPQQILPLTYKDKNISKKELILWLDKKLRFSMIDKSDKVKFLEKSIDSISNYTVQELSINRYVLLDKLNDLINSVLIEKSKITFFKLLHAEEIKLKKFEKFPESITLSEESFQAFNKNYYDKIDKLNEEELRFVERLDLDTLPNIKFWIRNREKKDPFYIRGWMKNRFYPDFIVVTNNGNTISLEWKGEDRVSNDDTLYKEKIGNIWQNLGNKKLSFFVVTNKNVEEILSHIKKL